MKSTLQPLAGLKPLIFVLLVIPLSGIASFEALFAPTADPWPRWQTHDPASSIRVNHDPWDQILGRHLREVAGDVNRFDYSGLKQGDQVLLDQYIDSLSEISVSQLNRPEQLAYWINLYNALTVQTIVRNYPVESIRDIDISPGFLADGPWDKPLITIEGIEVTLNDAEHRILRPFWKDPRLHYAVNCASIGCPNLASRAYRPATIEAMLDRGARDYINSPRGVWWDGENLGVSSIYVWFRQDFGGNDRTIIAHLKKYAKPELKQRLAAATAIHDHGYDWRLNEVH